MKELYSQSSINLSNLYYVQGSVHSDSQQGCICHLVEQTFTVCDCPVHCKVVGITTHKYWWGSPVLLTNKEASSHLSKLMGEAVPTLPDGAGRTWSLPSGSWGWYHLAHEFKDTWGAELIAAGKYAIIILIANTYMLSEAKCKNLRYSTFLQTSRRDPTIYLHL